MTSTTSESSKNNSSSVITPIRRFIKLHEVKSLTTLSTSEIYRRIAAGTFPKQVSLGPKSVVWIESEVLAWCEVQISASRSIAA
ncbi:helix-turn-helix transcriptional regulator [Pseudomonas sp. N040]|uniref:helix-turn-helix transcriptional regulator n=1 Tax=Pseudomonas sp. N040 TaxID=2785325 RepID=UPI0018A336A2|nr:AlpA family transcriptional regulator [Pseudomonas sp. N040]MBF7731123.1 AlpA family transcriptional regulator [Pseudomonas sp. N040]MBW7014766.1 AlpA family transcriptional regulator [Pseudomonas sp. N040]